MVHSLLSTSISTALLLLLSCCAFSKSNYAPASSSLPGDTPPSPPPTGSSREESILYQNVRLSWNVLADGNLRLRSSTPLSLTYGTMQQRNVTLPALPKACTSPDDSSCTSSDAVQELSSGEAPHNEEDYVVPPTTTENGGGDEGGGAPKPYEFVVSPEWLLERCQSSTYVDVPSGQPLLDLHERGDEDMRVVYAGLLQVRQSNLWGRGILLRRRAARAGRSCIVGLLQVGIVEEGDEKVVYCGDVAGRSVCGGFPVVYAAGLLQVGVVHAAGLWHHPKFVHAELLQVGHADCCRNCVV